MGSRPQLVQLACHALNLSPHCWCMWSHVFQQPAAQEQKCKEWIKQYFYLLQHILQLLAGPAN